MPEDAQVADDSRRPATRRQKKDQFNRPATQSVILSNDEKTREKETAPDLPQAVDDPPVFDLHSLRRLVEDGKLERVGALEIGLEGARQKESLSVVNGQIRKFGGLPLSVADYNSIRQHSNIRRRSSPVTPTTSIS